MYETIAFLKNACGGSYHFVGDWLYCSNESMMLGAPNPVQSLLQEDFNVPQKELEDVLRRISVEPEASFDGELQVRGGRLRASIQVDRAASPPIMERPEVWLPRPEELGVAIEMARCFTDDGARWTAGIRLMTNRVTAICNLGGVDVTVSGLTLEPPILISDSTAEMLCKYKPAELSATDGALWARWTDGRWMRAQLLAAEMPAGVDGIFASAKGPALVDLNDEYRSAFEDAAALTDSVVELRPSGFSFARGVERGEAVFDPGFSDDHLSIWWTKVLAPVVKYATRWNPFGYPDPVLFEGNGFRGVIMGRR